MYEGIYKLIEELGELQDVLGALQQHIGRLQQALGKLGTCGDGEHWDGKGKMRARIIEEIADVRAALGYFEKYAGLDRDMKRVQDKRAKFEKWKLKGLSNGQ